MPPTLADPLGTPGWAVLVLDAEAFAGAATYRTLGLPLRAKGQIFGGLALSSVREEEPLGEPNCAC